jgi:branched-chain amino acid transport system ATP-binding protein
VHFAGREIVAAAADAIVKAGIAQVPQGRGTFVDLSVEDNLRVGAITRKDEEIADDIARWLDVFPRLKERRTQKAGSLSGGEQQMLAIARAVMSRPRLLLCDEPSLGLAPIIVQELFATLARLNDEEDVAILLVEQNANLAIDIADRVYVLETGGIAASGDAASMRDDESIRKAYLGY